MAPHSDFTSAHISAGKGPFLSQFSLHTPIFTTIHILRNNGYFLHRLLNIFSVVMETHKLKRKKGEI